MNQKTYYYDSLTDDIVESRHQDYQLPSDYQWLPRGLWQSLIRWLVRTGATGFAFIYTRLFCGVKIINRAKLKPFRQQAYIIYGNHTQPVNDVFMPLLITNPYHFYALAAPANWGIPIIGKLLKYGGAIPTGQTQSQLRSMLDAIDQLLHQAGHLVIYPEAHVWPSYTKIRPFATSSFRFAVSHKVPTFVMTTTYQGKRWTGQPKIVVYLDGPYQAPTNLKTKAQQKWLHDQVSRQMQQRAQLNTYQQFNYQKEDANQ